jgi:GTP:adenosylcobinamide-phosphate guanylyltransferase
MVKRWAEEISAYLKLASQQVAAVDSVVDLVVVEMVVAAVSVVVEMATVVLEGEALEVVVDSAVVTGINFQF